MKIPHATSVLAFLIAAAIAAGIGTSSALSKSAATAPSSVTVAISGPLLGMDGQAITDRFLQTVTNNVYERLLGRTPDRKLLPVLAATLPKRIDATTWRFTLRRGVSFTNGEPLDARAVAYSIGRILRPSFNSQWLARINTIATVKVRSKYSLDIVTKDRDEILPARVTLIDIVPPKYSQTPAFLSHPVGTGPYVWVSGGGSGPIVLKRNTRYWGKAPKIQNVTVRVITDLSTRIAALRAGEVDMITELTPDAAKNLPKVRSAVGISNPTLILNTPYGLTSDIRVRQAMNYAIDKQALAKDLYSGFAQVSKCQVLAPSGFGYDPSLKPYAYDPQKAKSLLDAAGATGKTVTLASTTVFPGGSAIVQAIAAYWENVGLKVNIQILPLAQYQANAIYAKGPAKPEATYVPTSSDLLDAADTVTALTSDGRFAGYANPTVDRLFTQAAQEPDRDKRAALYHRIFKTACDDAAQVNLLNPEDIYGLSTRLAWTPRFDTAILFSTMSVAG